MDSEQKLETAKGVFRQEIETLICVQKKMGGDFLQIEEAVISCKGKVILCGMGKSGHIAKKISATLASLGTPSFFLHPAEALHGDLGMVTGNDIVFLLSNSGETPEIIQIIPSLKFIGARLIAVTGNSESILARECDLVQILDIKKEAGHLRLAPTTSTTAMLVYGDALAVTVSEEMGFKSSDFGLFHPAGMLGKKVLTKVGDIMAKGDEIPIVYEGCKITEAIIEMSKKGLGTLAIKDRKQKLTGILTDGDLRRAIGKKIDLYNDIVDSIMTKNPKYIYEDILLVDALKKLKQNKLNNYPVINEQNCVIGMLTWQMIIREGIV